VREIRRIDHLLRDFLHVLHELALCMNAAQNSAVFIEERMLASRLLEALNENGIGGIEKQDNRRHTARAHHVERRLEAGEENVGAGIDHHGESSGKGRVIYGQALVNQLRQKHGRQVIHHREVHVLEGFCRQRLTRAGHTGDEN
jgi:hypothetical protein